jgi:hypothetical protein
MSTIRDDGSVVVLELLGEGGGYRILGREVTDGAWQFKVDRYDMTLALIDEESIVRRGDWVPTLQDVLGQINRSWYRLSAREVHPKFQTALLAEVTQRMLKHTGENGERAGLLNAYISLNPSEDLGTRDRAEVLHASNGSCQQPQTLLERSPRRASAHRRASTVRRSGASITLRMARSSRPPLPATGSRHRRTRSPRS